VNEMNIVHYYRIERSLFQLTLISNNVWLYWPCHFSGSVSIGKRITKIKIEFIVQFKLKYWHKYVINVIKIGLCRHLKLFVHKAYYIYRASAKIELNVESCKGWKKFSQIIRCLHSIGKHVKKIRKCACHHYANKGKIDLMEILKMSKKCKRET
jgi:hypothetical protein